MKCELGNLSLYYEEAGSGRPLLMLHGLPGDHRHMVDDMEPLFTNRPGWRRIYPDLPGMGNTPAPDWITSQDQMLDVVLAFIDHLFPGQRFAVAGSSYGAYLAQGLVVRRGMQMDGLLLTVPNVPAGKAKKNLPLPRVIHEDESFLAALEPDEQGMREYIVVQSLDLLQRHRQVFKPAFAMADNAFLERLGQHFAFSFDLYPLPAPFPAPALLVAGRHDSWCGYREAYQILDDFPRASFAVLDRAGHALSFEQRTLFRALVSEWLDRVEEYAPKADK